MNVDYNKCKEIVQKLEKHFVNERELASVNFPRSIPYGTMNIIYTCFIPVY